jgi:hypothetical protein
MSKDESWQKICDDYGILKHDFSKGPFVITNEQIKKSCQQFTRTVEKEVRILCKQDSREDRPKVFHDNSLFLLPIKNGVYIIVQGEGYFDIPKIQGDPLPYKAQLDFELKTSVVGNSEMQHLDFAYATSLIRTFMNDPSLVLTIRGRKYTPKFSFILNGSKIEVDSVQTEVDAGYEGKNQIVLVEAKSRRVSNTIIRQLFYPYRQWSQQVNKPVALLFFEMKDDMYFIWQFCFAEKMNPNSIILVKSAKYKIL